MWAVSTLKPAVGGAEGASPLFLFSLSLNLNQTIRLLVLERNVLKKSYCHDTAPTVVKKI